MTTQQTYAAYDCDGIIWGLGETESAARRDGIDWISRSGLDVDVNVTVELCTSELAAAVANSGGQIGWEWSGNPARRVMQLCK